jgi:hypothetical protein
MGAKAQRHKRFVEGRDTLNTTLSAQSLRLRKACAKNRAHSLILLLWAIGLVFVLAAIWNLQLQGEIATSIGLTYVLLLLWCIEGS